MTGAKGCLIDNRWTQTEDVVEVLDPSDGRPFAAVAAGGAREVEAAVAAARRAADGGGWSRLTATDRGRLLSRLGAMIEREAEALAALEARDAGKPLSQARADMVAAARYFEYYGGAADEVHGETIPFMAGYCVQTWREPHGVTGHIIPWNYPAQMVGRTLAPALAMGNATVLKPAEEACLTPLRIAELALEAGFPSGAVNVVPGRGEEAGAALAASRGVDFLSFTGSPEVGAMVQAAAARNHVGCTLELGGKSPQIVFADADLDRAIPTLCNAIVQNGGQTSSAGSRNLMRIANATDYGLVAGVWTADGARQARVARALRCGQVFLDGFGAGGGIELPFGGVRRSGHGREKGFAALHELSQIKTVVLHHG